MSTINQAALGNAAGNYGLLGGLGSYLGDSLGNYLQTGMSSGNWGKGNLIGAFGDKGATYAGGTGSLTGFDSGLGAVAGFAGGLLDRGAAHQRTAGKEAALARSVDTVANTVGALGNYNPLATGLGRLGMGAVNNITGGTDGMTKTDALLGSGAVQGTLTGIAAATGPIGWGVAGAYLLASGINAATGKTTTDNAYKSFMDRDKLTDVASGYTDMGLENDALSLYNKKYGGFSMGAYKKAQKKIDQALMRMTDKMAIRDTAELGKIRAGMVDANNMRYQMSINGGYRPMAIGKEGLKITPERLAEAKRIAKYIRQKKRNVAFTNVIPSEAREAMRDVTKVPNDAVPFFLEGGRPKLNSKETGEDPIGYLNDGTPLYVKGDGTIGPLTKEDAGKENLFDLIKNSNANFAKRLQDPNRKYITYPDGSWGNFKLAWSEDETGVIVYPEIQEINGKLIDLSSNPDKAWESAIKHNDYVYFPSREAADWFTKNYKNYYKGFDESTLKFKEGGTLNVIPEGALHARKHHMENDEHITKKGIPVVDINGVQQAEIECNEIIFRKEVTNRLEELAKDGSDEAAVEAGKLLAEEIIENTEDRTGLIEQVTGESPKSPEEKALENHEVIPKGDEGLKFPFDISKLAGLGDQVKVNYQLTGAAKKALDDYNAKNAKKAMKKQVVGLLGSNLLTGLSKGIDTYNEVSAELKEQELALKKQLEEQVLENSENSWDLSGNLGNKVITNNDANGKAVVTSQPIEEQKLPNSTLKFFSDLISALEKKTEDNPNGTPAGSEVTNGSSFLKGIADSALNAVKNNKVLTAEDGSKVPSLEEYMNQKIKERTESAILKAITRKTPYMFKNKGWKNCIATLSDNYGVPIILRNSDLAADPNKYGFEEIFFGDNTDTLPDGTIILDYNKEGDSSTPGHSIMLVGRDDKNAPIYSWSKGDSDAKSMINQSLNYFFRRWDDKVKPRAYRYIGTPAERKAWEEEYNTLYPKKFENGGILEELSKLSPEKLEELKNILKYLNQ